MGELVGFSTSNYEPGTRYSHRDKPPRSPSDGHVNRRPDLRANAPTDLARSSAFQQ